MSASVAMDRVYRRQRHIYDVTRRYYLLGRDQTIAALQPGAGQAVLEIGCGTGRNCVETARLYPAARVFGFDVSPAMLETASESVGRAGLAGRIALAQGDATEFDMARLFPDGPPVADRILLSYVVSMIPDWPAALACAVRALAPGGRLHLVDFGAGRGLPAWAMVALDAWLARFSVTRRLDLPECLADLAARHGLRLTLENPWRGYALMATLARPA